MDISVHVVKSVKIFVTFFVACLNVSLVYVMIAVTMTSLSGLKVPTIVGSTILYKKKFDKIL